MISNSGGPKKSRTLDLETSIGSIPIKRSFSLQPSLLDSGLLTSGSSETKCHVLSILTSCAYHFLPFLLTVILPRVSHKSSPKTHQLTACHEAILVNRTHTCGMAKNSLEPSIIQVPAPKPAVTGKVSALRILEATISCKAQERTTPGQR